MVGDCGLWCWLPFGERFGRKGIEEFFTALHVTQGRCWTLRCAICMIDVFLLAREMVLPFACGSLSGSGPFSFLVSLFYFLDASMLAFLMLLVVALSLLGY